MIMYFVIGGLFIIFGIIGIICGIAGDGLGAIVAILCLMISPMFIAGGINELNKTNKQNDKEIVLPTNRETPQLDDVASGKAHIDTVTTIYKGDTSYKYVINWNDIKEN